MASHIGTLREGPLHAALKEWYAEPHDLVEHPVDGHVIDLVRGDLLIEIQTGGFAPLKAKLERLIDTHPVRVVYPIALDTWIVRVGHGGEVLSRRRSPKHETVPQVFSVLVSITDYLGHPNLELDVVSTRQEQIRRYMEGKAWRRRGWVVDRRALLEVVDLAEIRSISDLAGLVPSSLPETFTTADVAVGLETSRRLAQQMTYCLSAAGAIERCGMDGRSVRYRLRP